MGRSGLFDRSSPSQDCFSRILCFNFTSFHRAMHSSFHQPENAPFDTMNRCRDDKSGLRTWAQLPHVFDFFLIAVLAVLVAHPCWALGNSADESTSSGATK